MKHSYRWINDKELRKSRAQLMCQRGDHVVLNKARIETFALLMSAFDLHQHGLQRRDQAANKALVASGITRSLDNP